MVNKLYKANRVSQGGLIKNLTVRMIIDEEDPTHCHKKCCYLTNLQTHPALVDNIGLCLIYNAYIINLSRYSRCLEEAK